MSVCILSAQIIYKCNNDICTNIIKYLRNILSEKKEEFEQKQSSIINKRN